MERHSLLRVKKGHQRAHGPSRAVVTARKGVDATTSVVHSCKRPIPPSSICNLQAEGPGKRKTAKGYSSRMRIRIWRIKMTSGGGGGWRGGWGCVSTPSLGRGLVSTAMSKPKGGGGGGRGKRLGGLHFPPSPPGFVSTE